MRRLSIILFVLFSLPVVATDQNNEINFQKKSQKGLYHGNLACKGPLTVGIFQNCSLIVKRQGKLISNEKVFLTGGMPAHQHGLPTAPKVRWNPQAKTYKVEGLKFSMPGKWLLNFRINGVQQDKIKFSINVDDAIKF